MLHGCADWPTRQLEEIQQAHRLAEKGGLGGKIVLIA
jgi:hypothetical protein